jgi:hypothetical protein
MRLNFNFLALATFAAAASVTPAGATTITLAAPSSVATGSFFDVVVQVSNVFQTHPGDSLAGFGFNVVLGNPAVFSYQGETVGALFDDFSGFPGSPQVVGIPSAFILTAADFTDPLTLATLHFHATGAGSTSIGISTDLSDPNQGLFYTLAGSDPLNASTNVSAIAPEPATAWLGFLALFPVLGLRARRRT